MNLVIFTPEDAGTLSQVLVDSIFRCHMHPSVQRFRAMSELEFYLKHPGENRGKEILVLLADSRERLNELTRLSAFLEDCRLILVVPDEAPDTLSAAHRLLPRFVTSVTRNYDDLCSVIHRMMEKAAD